MLTLDVKKIGIVRDLGEGRSLLSLQPGLASGLQGLEIGDRVQILYWMHELTPSDRRILETHPRGDESVALCGVFALRSPFRPNPIGVSEVEVVELRDSGLVVTGLDARDGSPILDLKAACR